MPFDIPNHIDLPKTPTEVVLLSVEEKNMPKTISWRTAVETILQSDGDPKLKKFGLDFENSKKMLEEIDKKIASGLDITGHGIDTLISFYEYLESSESKKDLALKNHSVSVSEYKDYITHVSNGYLKAMTDFYFEDIQFRLTLNKELQNLFNNAEFLFGDTIQIVKEMFPNQMDKIVESCTSFIKHYESYVSKMRSLNILTEENNTRVKNIYRIAKSFGVIEYDY